MEFRFIQKDGRGVYVFDPNKIEGVLKRLLPHLDELLSCVDEDTEALEPKVFCKRKNTVEELVRILKLNRARRGDN
jgi:hypothetical protein